MPMDLNNEGDNPFFVGHRQQDAYIDSGGRNKFVKTPAQEMSVMLRNLYPNASISQLDRIKKQLESEGSLENLGTPAFRYRLKEVANAVIKSKKIVDRFIKDKSDGKE